MCRLNRSTSRGPLDTNMPATVRLHGERAVYSRYRNLVHMLEAAVANRPDAPVYTFLEGGAAHTLTYARLARRARALAHALRERGAAGQRALILCAGGPETASALWGCLYAGVTAIPVQTLAPTAPRRQRGWLSPLIDHFRPAVLLSDMAAREGAHDHRQECDWLATDHLASAPTSSSVPPASDAIEPHSTALIHPSRAPGQTVRGTIVSHANALSSAALQNHFFRSQTGDAMIVCASPEHAMGLFGGLLAGPEGQLHTIFAGPATSSGGPVWLRALGRYQAPLLLGSAASYRRAAETASVARRDAASLAHVRVAGIGGDVAPATLRRFVEAFAPAGFRASALRTFFGLADSRLFMSGDARLEADSAAVCRGGAQVRVIRLARAALAVGCACVVSPDEDQPAAEFVSHGPCPPRHRQAIVGLRKPLKTAHWNLVFI